MGKEADISDGRVWRGAEPAGARRTAVLGRGRSEADTESLRCLLAQSPHSIREPFVSLLCE